MKKKIIYWVIQQAFGILAIKINVHQVTKLISSILCIEPLPGSTTMTIMVTCHFPHLLGLESTSKLNNSNKQQSYQEAMAMNNINRQGDIDIPVTKGSNVFIFFKNMGVFAYSQIIAALLVT
ncbi:hypothetical protein R6Q59_011589 [Mikania micrantha]